MKVVIKLGGQVFAQHAASAIAGIAHDLYELKAIGYEPILVHGGGVLIDNALKQSGIEPLKRDGLRITDAQTMEVVQQILDKINADLAEQFTALGHQIAQFKSENSVLQAKQTCAIGLDGVEFDLGFVGSVHSIDATSLLGAIAAGAVPLVAPLAIGTTREDESALLNVNADDAARAIAEHINADMLVFMSDVPGVIGADNIGVKTLRKAHSDHLSSIGTISGGMRAKLHNAFRAAESGVRCVQIVDGTQPHSLIESIYTPGAKGTLIAC